MSEAELSWKFRLHLTQAAVVSTEELGLDYFLLILWGHGHYGVKPCGISQCTLMREGDCAAGPQLLPALVSALQGTGNALSKPWRRGGPRPRGLAIKEGQRLRWDFKDLLVSVYFIQAGYYWLAAFLRFAIKPSLEDWKFRNLIILQNFPENVHVWRANGRAVAEADTGLLEILVELFLPWMT